jgi:hypothetical protein
MAFPLQTIVSLVVVADAGAPCGEAVRQAMLR